MGFPSPAMDYVERQLSPVVLCHIKPESRVLETDTGYAVIEPATKKTPGDVLLILCEGHTQFAKLMGKALITDDGEAIEGTALEEVEVMGRVTFFINRARDDELPIYTRNSRKWLDQLGPLVLHIAHGARHGVPDKLVGGHCTVGNYLLSFFPAYILTHPLARSFR